MWGGQCDPTCNGRVLQRRNLRIFRGTKFRSFRSHACKQVKQGTILVLYNWHTLQNSIVVKYLLLFQVDVPEYY